MRSKKSDQSNILDVSDLRKTAKKEDLIAEES